MGHPLKRKKWKMDAIFRRAAERAPETPAEERDRLIAEWLKKHTITKCPSMPKEK